jgi:hypothetical protein
LKNILDEFQIEYWFNIFTDTILSVEDVRNREIIRYIVDILNKIGALYVMGPKSRYDNKYDNGIEVIESVLSYMNDHNVDRSGLIEELEQLRREIEDIRQEYIESREAYVNRIAMQGRRSPSPPYLPGDSEDEYSNDGEELFAEVP